MRIADEAADEVRFSQPSVLAASYAGEQIGAVQEQLAFDIEFVANAVDEFIDCALGDPIRRSAEVEHHRPVLVDAAPARLRPSLEPFVGALQVELGGRIAAAERGGEFLARARAEGGSGQAQFSVDALGHLQPTVGGQPPLPVWKCQEITQKENDFCMQSTIFLHAPR